MKVAHWKPLHPTFLELTQKTVYNINQYLLSFGCPVVEPDMTIQGFQEFIQHCSFQLIQEAMISEEDAKSRIKEMKRENPNFTQERSSPCFQVVEEPK